MNECKHILYSHNGIVTCLVCSMTFPDRRQGERRQVDQLKEAERRKFVEARKLEGEA
jgi:hypothetical protein